VPRDGAVTLGEYPIEDVRFECRCGRNALYRRAELTKRAGADAALPTLRLKVAKRVGCEIAVKNLAGPAPGYEQCQMSYPDLARLDAEAGRRRIEAAGSPSVRQYMDEDREDERFSREV
jgi:hypothetical protein